MSREQFRFAHALRVRWAEVDPQGIVFNANYLMYFDVAATEYWRAIGCTYPGAFAPLGVDTFAVKATLEFQAPARFDDVIDVCVRCARLGRTSLRMLLEVHRERRAAGERRADLRHRQRQGAHAHADSGVPARSDRGLRDDRAGAGLTHAYERTRRLITFHTR